MTKIYKRISDPIHGTVLLTKLEADIISSKAFQRLHNVRQLGLAHLVFPGANYSRFSHSIGACHNASKMLDAVHRNSAEHEDIITQKTEACRLAALLHDIGHYPFSHATEHVIENFYKRALIRQNETQYVEQAKLAANNPPSFDHETLGRKIIENDPELQEIFDSHSFNVDAIKGIFSKEDPSNTLVEIISSDLDCDRLDYLRRTAHHTGLPYGGVDIDFLISQAILDKDGRFCFSNKALHAADHLLMSRYFDYLQVPYHKTTAALEWSLVTCIERLLENKIIDGSAEGMINRIKNGEWHSFDDHYFFYKFKELKDQISESESVLTDHLRAILERRAARLVFNWEELVAKTISKNRLKELIAKLDKIILALCEKHSELKDRLKVSHYKIPFAKYRTEQDDEELAGAVRVLLPNQKASLPLCRLKNTLFSALVDSEHLGVRVYYLPGTNDLSEMLQDELAKNVAI